MASESDIISWLRTRTEKASGVVVGIGDDAAVLKSDSGRDWLLCCDLVIEGVHFSRDWSPPASIGYKALAATVSDIAAMGGAPRFALVSVAVPEGLAEIYITQLLDGVLEAATEHNVALVGGDTSRSPDAIFVDVTVLGDCSTGRSVKRSGARPGDAVLVSGALGASALGLRLLKGGLRLESASTEAQLEALGKQLQPQPRTALGQAIGELGLATSMIDISDGLSTDLNHLLEESGRGAVLNYESIPIAHCVSELAPGLGLNEFDLALNSGEEYELLMTVNRDGVASLKDLAGSLAEPISVIGEIRTDPGLFVQRKGRLEPIAPGGFEHRF